MPSQEVEGKRKRVRRVVNSAIGIALAASQVGTVIAAAKGYDSPNPSTTNASQIDQERSSQKAKRPHGGIKIQGPTIGLGQISNTGVSERGGTTGNKTIGRGSHPNISPDSRTPYNLGSRIAMDANLRVSNPSAINLGVSIDINKEIQREKEKEGLYKMIALIEKVAPDEAVKLIKQLTSEKTSITALENQARKIVNDNVANLISIVPIEDLAKIGQLDFISVSQDSPLTSILADFEGLNINKDLKATYDLVVEEVTGALNNHEQVVNWGDFGTKLLKGLGLAGATLTIFTQLFENMPGIIASVQQAQEKAGKKKVPTKLIIAGALFTLACLSTLVPVVYNATQTPDSPATVTVSPTSTEIGTSPTAMPQAEVVNINNFIIDLAHNTPGLAVSSENPSLSETDKALIMQYQNAPDIKNSSVTGFDSRITTEVFSVNLQDGISFQSALSTLTYMQNGKESGQSIFYQYRDSDGTIKTYLLNLINTQTIDGKIVRTFAALPGLYTGGAGLENVIIGVYNNETAVDPDAVLFRMLSSNNGELQVLPLYGEAEIIQQIAHKVNALIIVPTQTETPIITDPNKAPENLPLEEDLGGTLFAWGGGHNDIPVARFDEITGKWEEIKTVELSKVFPKSRTEINALPTITVNDIDSGSTSRSTLESLDDSEISNIIPATWSRTLFPNIGAESISADLTSFSSDIDLNSALYSKSVRYARAVDETGNTLGVAAVVIFINTDGSRVALTTLVDTQSWVLDDFTSACMGQGIVWPSGSNGVERIHSPIPAFNYLPDRLDKLGSPLIFDILDQYGLEPQLELFAEKITNGSPIPKSASTLPMVVTCQADDRTR
ncbi:hypothetical protein HZA76_01945 [Candidatus Roizmanbacteria bacterium]|nr:hypothetical protein [Candidatus Roizmanbacteria bacterium]